MEQNRYGDGKTLWARAVIFNPSTLIDIILYFFFIFIFCVYFKKGFGFAVILLFIPDIVLKWDQNQGTHCWSVKVVHKANGS